MAARIGGCVRWSMGAADLSFLCGKHHGVSHLHLADEVSIRLSFIQPETDEKGFGRREVLREVMQSFRSDIDIGSLAH